MQQTLRERKRAETWAALHEAAAAMVLEDGLHAATIEAIAAQANVSTRTFFNYFASKEDAVLGLREPRLDERTREEFLAAPEDDDLLRRTMHLVLTVARAAGGAAPDRVRRREILRRHPSLVEFREPSLRAVETIARELLTERIVATSGASPDPQYVDMVIALATTALRFAAGTNPAFSTLDDVEDILDDTAQLLREAARIS